jgi:hypothetical protein
LSSPFHETMQKLNIAESTATLRTQLWQKFWSPRRRLHRIDYYPSSSGTRPSGSGRRRSFKRI